MATARWRPVLRGAERTRRPKRSRPARRPRSSSSSKSASSLKADPTLPVRTATSAASRPALGPLPLDGDGVGGLEALVREPAEIARQASAAAHLQPAHLGVGEQAVLGQLAPQDGDLPAPVRVPAPRSGDRPRPVAVAGQHGDEDLTQGQQRRLRQHPHQVDTGVALEHGPQLVTALQHLHGDRVASFGRAGHHQWLEPAGHGLTVAHPRLGRHDHARARHLAAPREVEVLPHRDDPAVEALQLGEEVGADQDAPARRHEDVAHRVVLPVVDLALDDAVDHGTRLVAAHPDVEQDCGIVPVHELGGHHAGIGAEGLLHELVDGVGVEGDVVVAEQEEGGPFHHAEHLVGGGRVPRTSRAGGARRRPGGPDRPARSPRRRRRRWPGPGPRAPRSPVPPAKRGPLPTTDPGRS